MVREWVLAWRRPVPVMGVGFEEAVGALGLVPPSGVFLDSTVLLFESCRSVGSVGFRLDRASGLAGTLPALCLPLNSPSG